MTGTEMIEVNAKPPRGARRDKDAVEIGRLHRLSFTTLMEAVKYRLECGDKLKIKRDSLKRGEWLPWLDSNRDTLGFGRAAAYLMIKGANLQSTVNLNEATAIAVSRQLWGNTTAADSQLVQQSLSNEHYTPAQYLDAARAVLGGAFDLDPASCEEANKIVRAKMFFTADDDGLAQQWKGSVWLNPPYGRQAGDFVCKLFDEYVAKSVTAGIVLVNAHCTDTDWFQPLWDGVLCFTDHRVNFYGDDERSGSTHGSVFVYFGPDEAKFAEAFRQFGAVVKRV